MSEPTAVPETPTIEVDVDPRLLEILVCPVTRGPLEYDREKGELISRGAKLAYPIRDGVPIMLPDEAREIDAD
jgi:uncharacterized protein YbaR (Trm112 family)